MSVVPTVDANGEKIVLPFDSEFQNGLVSLALRDTAFMRRCSHLLYPSHFEDVGNAGAVQIAVRHYKRFGCAIDKPSLEQALVDAIKEKVIGPADKKPVLDAIARAFKEGLPNSKPIEDRLATFAREQAVQKALLNSVDKLNKQDFDGIEKTMRKALEVGANEDGDAYDYFKEIEERTQERRDSISGVLPPRGITTGISQFDALLYHRGWGRKEMTVLMAGAKQGKTLALINFAANASRAGFNVLYTTLEVSARIISERLDAYITQTNMRDLNNEIMRVDHKVKDVASKSGRLIIHEFASGSMTPTMLRNLIERYRQKGIIFDLVCVDYADIMAPDHRTDNPIENSKEIYVGLRALAFEFDCAILTATQTNRDGYKAQTAKAEHVAEDFNKIRTADLVISINSTEEERAQGVARLYFAASRNQESGFTVRIKQNIRTMTFFESMMGVE